MTTIDEIITAILNTALRVDDVRAIRNALPDCRGQRAKLTHCKRGHARTPDNVRTNGDCSTCHRERLKRRYDEKKCRYCKAVVMVNEQFCETHIRWKRS